MRDFDQGRKDFLSSVPYQDAGKQHPLDSNYGSKRVLNRPDAQTSKVESKVDKLAEQLAELSLIVRKQTGSSSSDRRETPRPCSFCPKPGHGANSYPENPHRDTRCSKCVRLGHSVATCYSCQKGTDKKRSPSTGRDDTSRANQVTVVTATPDVVGTTKRTMTGEAVPKQRQAEGINTDNLMHPAPGRILTPLQLEPLPI